MTIDLDNDQQITQDDNIESLVLDKFTLDIKALIRPPISGAIGMRVR